MTTEAGSTSSDHVGGSKHVGLALRLKRAWRQHRWVLVAVLGASGLVLGYVGFAKHAQIHGDARSPWDLIYLVLQLISLESGSVPDPVPWELVVARMLVPLVTGYAAVSALAVLFGEQIQRMSMRFARNHVVICGLGRMGLLLAGECSRRGIRVALIELDGSNGNIGPARQAGATVIIGDARDLDTLRSAGAHHARYLVVLCGEDATNAEIAILAQHLGRGRSQGVLTCILQIGDPTLSELLRPHTLTLEETSRVRLEILNLYDLAARSILKSFPALLGRDDVRTPHIIVVGGGYLGTSLILNASLAWRRLSQAEHNRLSVSLIDPKAQWIANNLVSRYAWLPQLCALNAHDIDVFGAAFHHNPDLNDALQSEEVTGICVCLDDNAKSLSAGLMLRGRIRGKQAPVIVRMTDNRGLARLLQTWDPTDQERAGLYAFPLLENVCQPDLVFGGIHEVLARTIHDDYVRTQTEAGQIPATNPSLVSWEELPERLKQMNREQSKNIGAKLRSIGCAIAPLADLKAEAFRFTPEEIEAMSEAEHERWMKDARRDGYRYSPGPKDPERKTHPSLVPWRELPEAEKDKDRAAAIAIPRLLALAGLQVYRPQASKRQGSAIVPGDPAQV